MLIHRPRRNRKNAPLRAMTQETVLGPKNFVAPHFVIEGKVQKEAIPSLRGIFGMSFDLLLQEAERALKLQIPAFALFPVIPKKDKDPKGSEALNPEGFLLKGIRLLKKEFPELCVITDIALDPYTSHGHDGPLNEHGDVCNDQTVEILTKMALLHADAGVDVVAPSDMMDGRVGKIRKALEQNGFVHTNILSYTAKYASSFYGPFREALGSSLKAGDKKSYQMNPANRREALFEAELDISEGADILMVKPALPYLDVLVKLRERTTLPLAAYQVSGEYAMIQAGEKEGWLDGKRALAESLIAIKRAGADIIFTYGAYEIAELIRDGALD